MTEKPPEEFISFVGSFLDYMVKSGWITMTLLIDRNGKFHPIVASNFESNAEEKREMLKLWEDAIHRADDADLFLKKEIRLN